MMQRLRLLVLGIVGFLGVFFAHGSWLNRLLAFTLCGVLSTDSGLCMAQIAKFSGQANATTPILLSQRSSEFDDPPSPSPSNNPQAPPFPLDAGPNFIRPDFGGDNSTPNNSTPSNSASLDLRLPSVQQKSPSTYEVSWDILNGCSAITTVKREQQKVYQESVSFSSSSIETCGLPSFTSRVSPEGNRIELQILGSEEIYITELLNSQSIKLTARNSNGEREIGIFSKQEDKHKLKRELLNIHEKQQTIDARTEALCTAGRRTCAGISAIGGVAGDLALLAAPLSFTPVGATLEIILGTIGLTTSVLGLGCFMMFGGLPSLPLPVRGRTISAVTTTLVNSYSYLSGVDSVLGESESNPDSTGIRDPGNKYPWDQTLADFRKNVGMDWCDKKPETPQPSPPQPTGPLKQGRSYGDPHIATFDGYGYSFQTIGEFILVQSKDGTFQVQTRQGQVPGRQMSLNTGVAMKVGNSKVSIYSKDFPDGNANNPVWVDDRPVAVERTLELPGGGSIQGGDGYYTIQFPTGERVIISRLNVAGISFMNVNPGVPEQADRYIGLLGNLNNNKDDDLQTRDGRVIPSKNNSTYGAVRQLLGNLGPIPLPLSQLETAFFDQLYKEFGDSWRVTQAESLFTYAPNQSTDTFTNRNFPNSYASLASLLPADIRRAEQICQQAGVPGDLLEGCLFDVAATGEGGFVQAALDNVLDQVRDRVQNEIRNLVPVPIPLPF